MNKQQEQEALTRADRAIFRELGLEVVKTLLYLLGGGDELFRYSKAKFGLLVDGSLTQLKGKGKGNEGKRK